MMKKNSIYKGFKVIDVVDLPECNSTGVYLKHQKLGMEVFHLVNDDSENLFAFSFRTPSLDSTGAAHVLEHSILCGSQKYPLKDPFINMVNQSVNTFLNAFTYPDHTVFPAASTVKADYFNLMDVYADSVFFPLLKPEIFLQECHRLELDDKSKPVIQGVVYNEMKGDFSSLDSVAYGAVQRVPLTGTSYEYVSGGDPLVIPSLTHSKLKAFHKKYYNPANCLLFLYGNIPTEEQLDKINESVLSKIQDPGKAVKWEKFPKQYTVPHYVKLYGPAEDNSKEDKSIVNLSWVVGTNTEDRGILNIEMLFLSELLWGSDSAPVAKALLDSKLGEDISTMSGPLLDLLFPTVSCGLRGVSPKNAKKVEKVIRETLESICQNGIPQEQLDRTAMTFDFSNKEVKRVYGPYSRVYMDRCIRGWQYGCMPWETLVYGELFAKVKECYTSEPGYIANLIRHYFLDNPRCTLTTVIPSESYSKKRVAEEKKIAKQQYAELGKEKVLKDLKKMQEFQNTPITEEEKEILPHISVSDLSPKVDKIVTKVTDYNGIPLFINNQPTNGIVYVDVAFPVDTLPAKDYPYLPALCCVATDIGWGNLTWDKVSEKVESITGGFGCYLRTSNVPKCSVERIKKANYVGRDWLIFNFKVLEENTAKAFELLSDCITQTNFKDKDRIKERLVSMYNSVSSNVVYSAQYYATNRAACTVDKSCAVEEIWYGISSIFTINQLSKKDVESTAKLLKNLFAKVTNAGAVIHVTGTSKGISKAKKCLPDFVKKTGITAPKNVYGSRDRDFYKLTELTGSAGQGKKTDKDYIEELIEIPGTVGFDGMSMQSADFDTKECVVDEVYTHSLSTSELWREIRMTGGAYGVGVSPVSDSGISRFYTYRDPKPFESINVFKDCVRKSAEADYCKADVDKAITGCYTDEVYPRTPSGTGATGFLWELYGLDNSMKARRIKWLLSLTPKDIKAAAQRYKEAVECTKTVVVCGKELVSDKIIKKSGKIIKLPL